MPTNLDKFFLVSLETGQVVEGPNDSQVELALAATWYTTKWHELHVVVKVVYEPPTKKEV